MRHVLLSQSLFGCSRSSVVQPNIRNISISMTNAFGYYVVIAVSAFADGFGWNGHPNYSLFQCLSMEYVSVYLCFHRFLYQCFLVFRLLVLCPWLSLLLDVLFFLIQL